MTRRALTLLVAAASLSGWMGASCAAEPTNGVFPEDAPEPASAAVSAPASKPLAAPAGNRASPSDSVERQLPVAEGAYRRGQWSLAMEGFKAVLAVDPDNARALLRVGNLHQRRGQWLSAASAYRKAASRAEHLADGADLRARALLNLAAVNLELASAALAELQGTPGAPSVPTDLDERRQELLSQVQRGQKRLDERAPMSAAERRPTVNAQPGLPSIEYLRGSASP